MNVIRKIFSICSVAMLLGCSHTQEFDASGNFEAPGVILSAESAGKILSFNVEEGDSVSVGQMVALIDTMQLHYQKEQLLFQKSASSKNRPDIAVQLASLQRELENRRFERRRIENLLADGAATQKQLDDINAAIWVIENQISAQESTLGNSASSISETAAAIAAQIQQIEQKISDCCILSPISGTVLTKYCQSGEYAMPGKPLLKIADLNKIYLRAYFTSTQLADLRIGQEVTVFANFGGDKIYEYPGIITWISSESEFTPKNIQTQDSRSNLVYAVKIAVNNDGRLKIGGYGNVKL